MESVLQQERDRAAVDRRQEGALRPSSYKNSLSLSMPVGTIRTKERPDRAEGLDRQQFENPNSIERTKTIEQEKEET